MTVLRNKSATLAIAALQYLADIAEFGIEEDPASLLSHAQEAKKIISELKGES